MQFWVYFNISEFWVYILQFIFSPILFLLRLQIKSVIASFYLTILTSQKWPFCNSTFIWKKSELWDKCHNYLNFLSCGKNKLPYICSPLSTEVWNAPFIINALHIYKHSHLRLHASVLYIEHEMINCRAAHLFTSSAATQIKLQEAENEDQAEKSKVTHHSYQRWYQGEVIQQVPRSERFVKTIICLMNVGPVISNSTLFLHIK